MGFSWVAIGPVVNTRLGGGGFMLQFDLRLFFKWVETEPPTRAGVIKLSTHVGGIKQYRSMVILRMSLISCALFGLVSYNGPCQPPTRRLCCYLDVSGSW